jgi:hypothetical protein
MPQHLVHFHAYSYYPECLVLEQVTLRHSRKIDKLSSEPALVADGKPDDLRTKSVKSVKSVAVKSVALKSKLPSYPSQNLLDNLSSLRFTLLQLRIDLFGVLH